MLQKQPFHQKLDNIFTLKEEQKDSIWRFSLRLSRYILDWLCQEFSSKHRSASWLAMTNVTARTTSELQAVVTRLN